MEPWETPALIGYSCEDVPSKTTRSRLLLRPSQIPAKWLPAGYFFSYHPPNYFPNFANKNGSNFTGAEKELKKGFLEIDHNQIRTYYVLIWLWSISRKPLLSSFSAPMKLLSFYWLLSKFFCSNEITVEITESQHYYISALSNKFP